MQARRVVYLYILVTSLIISCHTVGRVCPGISGDPVELSSANITKQDVSKFKLSNSAKQCRVLSVQSPNILYFRHIVVLLIILLL